MPVPADRLSLYDNAVLPFQLFRMGEIPSGGNETLMSVELGMGYFQRSNFTSDVAHQEGLFGCLFLSIRE